MRQLLARQCRRSALATSDADGFGNYDKRDPGNPIELKEWRQRCTVEFVFRIDKEPGQQRTRLTVSGEISSACVELLESCCEQAIKDGKAVHLVLDVRSIDDRGQALLRRMAAKGVRIFAKGIYHSYVVDTIRRAANRDRSIT